MSLTFPHASLLGLSQESRFFGAGFNYANQKRLTLNGLVTDLAETYGITGVWDGPQGVLATIANNTNFQPLVIGGVNFGSGRIQNLSFSPGIDVKTKAYTADLIVFDSGDLFNFTGYYYSGINTSGWQYLQTFSEDYAFTRKENGGYSYSHNANIRFNSGVGQLDAINAAKALAKSLFTGSNLGFAFYSGYTNVSGKRYHRESYDLIDSACAFEETFDFDSYLGGYSVTRTNQFQLELNGVANVSESAQIQGLQEPTYAGAMAAISTEITGAFDRCNSLFQLYASPDLANPLNSQPTISNRAIDIFNGRAGYNLTYTNDISNSGSFTWDYTQTLSYSQGVSRLQEAGTVIGRGFHYTGAYGAALNGYSGVKGTATSRSLAFYSGWVGQNNASSPVFQESMSEQHSPVGATIGYDFGFSNEPVAFGTLGVKRINIARQDNQSVTANSEFAIFNNPIVLQNQKTVTAGDEAITLNLLGEIYVPLADYLTNAKDVYNTLVQTLSGYTPEADGYGYYIAGAHYAFRPNANTLTTTVNYANNVLK